MQSRSLEFLKEVLEGITCRIRLFIDDLDVETGEVLRTPVLLDALLHELVLVEVRALRVVHDVEFGPGPHITDIIVTVLFTWLLAHAKHQHLLSVLQILKVEHGDRRVPLWEAVELGLEELLELDLVGVVVLLLHHRVPHNFVLLAQVNEQTIPLLVVHICILWPFFHAENLPERGALLILPDDLEVCACSFVALKKRYVLVSGSHIRVLIRRLNLRSNPEEQKRLSL